jgi:hypothetical protein
VKTKPSSALDEIIDAYHLECDLLKIARRAVDSGQVTILSGTGFIARSADAGRADVRRLRARLDDVTIMALWAVFERYVLTHVISQVRVGSASTPSDALLEDHIAEKLEYSRFDELLDLYKARIDARDVGDVKNVKKYRDWIAHRNPKRTPPAVVDPVTVRAKLGDVMDQIV